MLERWYWYPKTGWNHRLPFYPTPPFKREGVNLPTPTKPTGNANTWRTNWSMPLVWNVSCMSWRACRVWKVKDNRPSYLGTDVRAANTFDFRINCDTWWNPVSSSHPQKDLLLFRRQKTKRERMLFFPKSHPLDPRSHHLLRHHQKQSSEQRTLTNNWNTSSTRLDRIWMRPSAPAMLTRWKKTDLDWRVAQASAKDIRELDDQLNSEFYGMPYSNVQYWTTDKDTFDAAAEAHKRELLKRPDKLWRQLEKEYHEHEGKHERNKKAYASQNRKHDSERDRAHLEVAETSRLGARVNSFKKGRLKVVSVLMVDRFSSQDCYNKNSCFKMFKKQCALFVYLQGRVTVPFGL